MLHTVALLTLIAAADPAYRVGTATNRIAVLPVACQRNVDPSLCQALGDSVALQMAKDPRIEVVNPHDLEVLVGAASLTELQNCGKDDCFAAIDFTRVDASYLLALDISRIGDQARVVARVVDLKRGQVIDRDEARAEQDDEQAIEKAARDVTMVVLVRRGLAQATDAAAQNEAGVSPVFWAGIGTLGVGALLAGGGGVLGGAAFLKATDVETNAAALNQKQFTSAARDARLYAYGADLLLVAGGVLAVAGGALVVVGGLQ